MFSIGIQSKKRNTTDVEPRYNGGPRDWQNMFAIKDQKDVSLDRGSFPYILLLLGRGISFVISGFRLIVTSGFHFT